MHKFLTQYCLIFGLIFSLAASAAPSEAPSPQQNETWGQMIWRDFISPVTTPAWIPLVSGTALTIYTKDFPNAGDNPLQNNWANTKPLGKSSQVGDILGQLVPNAVYFAGMYADYFWGSQDKKSRERAILMFKATAYAGLTSLVLKYPFHERRPNGSNDYASFPSGHSTTAFAFAAVVGAEHEWYWGVPAYAMATFVAASRINDNMHRLHDVIGGATIGLSYGLGLYYRMHASELAQTTAWQVLPTDDLDGAMLSVTHEF